MDATSILVLMAIASCTIALTEGWLYRRRLARIPIRIHVNGTRGKSSVTRLIAAGLRAGGVRTCAKTTGTLARMIFSDGREVPIFRPSRANVIEQKRVIRAAVADRAEALVIECMALQPALQSVCELKLVQSTHGVITNAREDHMDVMGPTRLDVARALCGTVPVAGKMFTAEREDASLEIMQSAVDDRGSRLELIDDCDRLAVTSEEMAGFAYLEHAENVALAVRVCESLGVSREDAIRGMWAATPDPGAMVVHRREHVHRRQPLHMGSRVRNPIHFVSAFAANDPESTTAIWNSTNGQFSNVAHRVVVMNCRVDRPDRSRTMAAACCHWSSVDRFVVTGTGTDVFLRRLLAGGVSADKIDCLGSAEPLEVVEATVSGAVGDSMMVGVGNVYGVGLKLGDFFEDDSRWPVVTEQPITTPALVGAA